MKILFTAPRFHTNQSAIVKGLTGKGHEVRYFVVFVGATEDHSVITPYVLKPSKTTIKEKRKLLKTNDESKVESIIGGHFIPDFNFFKRAFEAFMPDVVVCREKTPLTLCAKALCDKYGIPCVLYDQEPIYKLKQTTVSAETLTKKSFYSRLEGKLEKIFNPDRRRLNKMRSVSGFPTVHMTPVKYSVIKSDNRYKDCDKMSHFIPLIAESQESAKNKEYCKDGILKILSVGKFRDYKNLKILPQAMERLLSTGFDKWSLTIVGQVTNNDERKYYEEVLSAIKEKGLQDKIKILLNVPFEKMSEIYCNHDLCVLTSKREVASVAVIEALSHGLAVVTTNHNGTASYVLDAKAGLTFETENAEDLANKIVEASERIEEFGRNGAEYVKNNLSFERYYTAFFDMVGKEFKGLL